MTIATAGSTLTACSNSQTQVESPSPAATNAGSNSAPDHSTMDHSQMNHGDMMNHLMDMDLGPADAEYDLRFIDAMIPHHRGAIEMANEALQKSQRSDIKVLAQTIIKAQNREENELMRKWRKAWYPEAGETPMAYDSQQGKMLPMSEAQKNSMMMKMDLGAADGEFDLRFMNAMIPHHEGAIAMAKDALTKAQHPELKQLANDIIASQQAEIDQMKQWRKTWYGK
ncbi:DUF305 domain-containing protein [Pantanalinema rosaneae CENA516]|uniref:DUF305 domain-containing protein n=1 Tax=Pantanalinema rosaneae TaxID=1620701 RepID=UPI003D6F509A